MPRDSVDKIITSYFASMAVEPFNYKGRDYARRKLVVSPLLFRGLICPAGCGACCHSITLDYLPDEAPFDRVPDLEPYEVEFNGRRVSLFRYNNDPTQQFCRHLNPVDARCMIHEVNPLSCSFEILRFLVSEEQSRFLTRYFGRGWNMARIDGGRGAKCGISEWDLEVKAWIEGQIKRLRAWMVHFGLSPERCDQLLDWVETGPHEEFLTLSWQQEKEAA